MPASARAKHVRTPSSKGKHAKPGLHPTRSTLSAGLTAALLPLCLASPAFADTPRVAAAPAVAVTAPLALTPPAAAPAKLTTVLRMSGPKGYVAPGRHTVYVRLLAGGKPVVNGYVRLEAKTSRGWVFVGRLLTKPTGLGAGKLAISSTTRLRATYDGTTTRTATHSGQILVQVGRSKKATVRPPAPPASSASFRSTAMRVATSQVGKPYRWGAAGPNSFDCSGLVMYSFAKVGKKLPHNSGAMRGATTPVRQSAKVPGDLIFMTSGGRISHVGIYTGNNNFVAAPRAGKPVLVQRIYTSSYLVGRVR